MSNNKIPRPEYPRPQLMRNDWINLNGIWEFEIDSGNSGRARNLHQAERLSQTICVPFCPESTLSGIGCKDFMNAVWYRRSFTVPDPWRSERVLLHFGAVDYDSEVWINGSSIGKHRGGHSSFSFEITDYLQEGDNIVTVSAVDDVRSGLQPGGKQSAKYDSFGPFYTRTTGIWQTVWLECVPRTYLESFKLNPDPDNASVHITAKVNGPLIQGMSCRFEAELDGKSVGMAEAMVSGHTVDITIALLEVALWEPGQPTLYDLRIDLCLNQACIDQVNSYFGLRTVTLQGRDMLINGKRIFQRLVLDQGYYPDGIMTAPSDDDLRKDIEIAMTAGFNGARLHQKIFEPRFLYWADRLGYLVWGEHASWGLDITTSKGLERFLPEWLEAVERDYNHPSIIGWCPFNETWDLNGTKQNDEVLRIVYQTTKLVDPTRPVKDTSGNFHVVTDLFSVHVYEQDPAKFAEFFEKMRLTGEAFNNHPKRQSYAGQPYHVSEYGGIWWDPETNSEKGWGYGQRPQSLEELKRRFEEITVCILNNPYISGFCYTQLYDLEQEVNGLYTYDRRLKFDAQFLRSVLTGPSAWEEQRQ